MEELVLQSIVFSVSDVLRAMEEEEEKEEVIVLLACCSIACVVLR